MSTDVPGGARTDRVTGRGSDAASCRVDDASCITCGDVAVPLTVVEVNQAREVGEVGDARCVDEEGREEIVAVDLVGPVSPGDRVLVHARVAIDRVDRVDVPDAAERVATTTPSTPGSTSGGERP